MNLNVVTTRPFVSCKITKKFLRKTTVPRKEFDRTPFGEHRYNETKRKNRFKILCHNCKELLFGLNNLNFQQNNHPLHARCND